MEICEEGGEVWVEIQVYVLVAQVSISLQHNLLRPYGKKCVFCSCRQ